MDQEAEYRRNQSRLLHARYRRNRCRMKVFLPLWFTFFTVMFLRSVVDRIGNFGWESSSPWAGLGFLAFGVCFWVFATLIQKIVLAYVRHTYGPDPGE
jgi:hypothetical protein